MAKLLLTLLLALVVAHATARNIPTDQTANPTLVPTQTTDNLPTATGEPATNAAVGDQKNFISYGGVGGFGGVGGYVGVLPVIGGVGVGGAGGAAGLGGVGGLGGAAGLGGVGGLGGLGGLGKVGGIGVGGGVGGIVP